MFIAGVGCFVRNDAGARDLVGNVVRGSIPPSLYPLVGTWLVQLVVSWRHATSSIFYQTLNPHPRNTVTPLPVIYEVQVKGGGWTRDHVRQTRRSLAEGLHSMAEIQHWGKRRQCHGRSDEPSNVSSCQTHHRSPHADSHTDEPDQPFVVAFQISLSFCSHVQITAARIAIGFGLSQIRPGGLCWVVNSHGQVWQARVDRPGERFDVDGGYRLWLSVRVMSG